VGEKKKIAALTELCGRKHSVSVYKGTNFPRSSTSDVTMGGVNYT